MARRKKNEALVEEPIEVIEEESGPGMGIDIGICSLTFLTLLTATIILMVHLGGQYGVGPFGG
ncbi:MAG: hypothetical protein CSA62_08895 [Planctomycetota bacterium]|nr:MAG: hypothetical protein CSA62_08895 [Planctomycetota bacterium]